ncbi:MAG: ribonuclease P protein component [Kiloniellales bacterium]|nr:ribonuclease P protein component [Kiloniellales bacterium]
MAATLGRLKRRPDFLRVAGSGRKWVTPGLILQVARRGGAGGPAPGSDDPAQVRVGFTVSRKVGNAVARNRARRRLKAAAEEVLPLAAEPGCDYVIIGRSGTLTRHWPALKQDLETALQGLARRRGPDRRPKRGTPRGGGRQGESGRRR